MEHKSSPAEPVVALLSPSDDEERARFRDLAPGSDPPWPHIFVGPGVVGPINLYKTTVLETCNITDIGYSWEDHTIDEHCTSSERQEGLERSQTGEKPSVYTQCVKAFAYNSHLQRHKRTHTGEKPYEYNQCDKAFAYHSYLLIHKRAHTGEKPY
ncbi:zinc finger protein 431-like, partial [Cricetulus griseus]|uniref:Zinc finger protein 431-like n=1 Tax=Cricetulus griseus TaxID=10029 RepID=A0A9J7GVB2_CRIGR